MHKELNKHKINALQQRSTPTTGKNMKKKTKENQNTIFLHHYITITTTTTNITTTITVLQTLTHQTIMCKNNKS